MNKTLSGRTPVVIFEGVDGSGKTTAAKALGAPVHAFPSNDLFGQKGREMAKAGYRSAASRLFFKDIAKGARERPPSALTVLDRSVFSTMAYEHMSGIPEFMPVERPVCAALAPFEYLLAVFYFDLPPEVAVQRQTWRGRLAAEFGEGDVVRCAQIQAAYARVFDRAAVLDENFRDADLVFVDATRPPEDIQATIAAYLRKTIGYKAP